MNGLLIALSHMNLVNVIKGVFVFGGPTIGILAILIMR